MSTDSPFPVRVEGGKEFYEVPMGDTETALFPTTMKIGEIESELQKLHPQSVLGQFQDLAITLADPLIATQQVTGSLLSGMLAEPIAGFKGAAELATGGSPQEASDVVDKTRKDLTYVPTNKKAQGALGAAGNFLEPLGKAIKSLENYLGNSTYDLTGSPEAAAAATTVPTALMEFLSFGAGSGASSISRSARLAKAQRATPNPALEAKVSPSIVNKALLASAPEVSDIKKAATAIYTTLDNLKVSTKPRVLADMYAKMNKAAKEAAVDMAKEGSITPKSKRVLSRMEEELTTISRPRTLSELNNLRQFMVNAIEGGTKDSRIVYKMLDEFDAIMDNLKVSDFKGVDAGDTANIGKQYASARGIWGRAKRAETIEGLVKNAELAGAGFSEGIIQEFRGLLRNEKRSQYFSPAEKEAMASFVKRSSAINTLRLVGQLGVGHPGSLRAMTTLLGVATVGMAALPVGIVSKGLASKLTVSAMKKIQTQISAGASGEAIARVYLKSVPKKSQRVEDLAQLLLTHGRDLDVLVNIDNSLIREAASIARGKRIIDGSKAAGAAAPQAIVQPTRENPDDLKAKAQSFNTSSLGQRQKQFNALKSPVSTVNQNPTPGLIGVGAFG